jgi:superfamily II DNA or RNA helicase
MEEGVMRLFSKKQKHAVELVTGNTGHGDHIVPHSKGGETSVENCQLISQSANSAKGAFFFKPRRWQEEFFRQWMARVINTFLLIVIPGGGKTMAALEAARRWMAAGSDRRLIVVVPTDNLREQWQEEAVKFGIELQTKEFGTNFKHGFQGGVVTYSLVASQPLVFRKLCSVAPTMVIFDEIHHCGEEASFGRGVAHAFELAVERLLLSGTAWRSDGSAIPWVQYDGNGFAVADYAYDYPHAINDDVVRFLVFDYSRGTITHDLTGASHTLSSESSEDEAACLLRRLLDARGDFVREQIRQAHQKLLDVRASFPDAGALAACIDQSHAVMVADVIREVTGCEPSVIVSDDKVENDTVRSFRNSKKEWIVAVRKVSEGTDIKRLQVLCYLTNTTAELFFRQLVGRVSRYRGNEDREAYVYLPADPRLIACAQNIENAQVQALKNHRDPEEVERPAGERADGSLFDSFSTAHDGTDLVMIGSEAVSEEVARHIQQIAEAEAIPMQKVLAVMQRLEAGFAQPAPRSVPSQSKEEAMDDLRRKCNKQAFRLSKLVKCKPQEVHMKFKPQQDMTEQELRAKLAAILAECKRYG